MSWAVAPALLAAALMLSAGSPHGSAAVALTAVVAMLACWAMGVAVTWRSTEQAAGWAFVGLGTALAWSAFTDEYAPPAATDLRPGHVLVATLGDTSFAWWFVFLARVLQYTPGADRAGPLVRPLRHLTLASGVLFQVFALLRSTPLDAPHQDLGSPWAVAALERPAAIGAAVAVFTLAGCVLLSFGVLVLAWRRAQGEARHRLLWLVAGAIPVPAAVVGAFLASSADSYTVAALLLGLGIVSLVLGAGFSALRYRLYDVERVVTESAAYAIASATAVLIVGVVVLVVGRSTPLDAQSQLPTAAATVLAVVAGRASYVWGARAVGRRVNRARFDAVETMRTGLAGHAPELDVLVTRALGDRARVLYPAGEDRWVTSQGLSAEAGPTHVEVRRHGVVTARVEYEPGRVDPTVVEAVAAAAAPEIDNVALRAELARQLEVVSDSRARLASAHLEERRRIERDLHDGAQQRLLAMALQLQAARLNGAPDVLTREVERAVDGLAATVQELRALAGGLQPAALAGGGVLAAVVDLAGRIPLRLAVDVADVRLPQRIEAAAWFVIAEGVANVVKHAQTDGATIALHREGDGIRVVVADQGCGGADPHGRGLAGLADRVAALRGTLTVRDEQPSGTRLEAVLPCAS